MSIQFFPKSVPFAAGDPLWVAELPLETIFSFFCDPVGWLADKSHPEQHVLTSPFVIAIEELFAAGSSVGDSLLLQGIDNTNLVTLCAAPGSAEKLFALIKSKKKKLLSEPFLGIVENQLAPFGSYRSFVGSFFGKDLEITVVDDAKGIGRAFIHFPLWKLADASDPKDPKRSTIEKHTWLAFFHLLAATDAKFLDAVLSTGTITKAPNHMVSSSGSLKAGSPITAKSIVFVPRNATVPLLYSDGKPDDEAACEMLVAAYNNGQISYSQAFCKPYAQLP